MIHGARASACILVRRCVGGRELTRPAGPPGRGANVMRSEGCCGPPVELDPTKPEPLTVTVQRFHVMMANLLHATEKTPVVLAGTCLVIGHLPENTWPGH